MASSMSEDHSKIEEAASLSMEALTTAGHAMHPDDPENPQNLPLLQKLHASASAFAYAFTLLFGATCYTAGLSAIAAEFDVSMTTAISGFSLYLFGIAFAPIAGPHLSERFGRNVPYAAGTLGLAVFTLGAGFARTFAQLAACRFCAGLLGGPAAVAIEGTFADVWPARFTPSYYVFLVCAQYFGAAVGAILGHTVVPTLGWRWTQYLPLMLALAALVLGLGAPETYARRIQARQLRRLASKSGGSAPAPRLPPAPTGVTLKEMATHTLLNPIVMLFTQPLVTMIALALALNFGVLFAWFVAVPAVLSGVYVLSPLQGGQAFATALGGTAAGAALSLAVDQVSTRAVTARRPHGHPSGLLDVEHRLIGGMVGAALLTGSLFWVGWTAGPGFSVYVPVVGNGVYVMGSAMMLTSYISYLFDAYSPQGTLSALTIVACSRIVLGGIIPLVILTAFTKLTGAWALSVFGFISIAFLPFPFVMFFFGKRLRSGSRFSQQPGVMGHMNQTNHMGAEA